MDAFLLTIVLALVLLVSPLMAYFIYDRKKTRWDPADLDTVRTGDYLRVTQHVDGKVVLAEGPVVQNDIDGFSVKDVEYTRYVYFTRTGLRLGEKTQTIHTEVRTKL